MSQGPRGRSAGDPNRSAFSIADGLRYAAAPTFAIMALLAGTGGDDGVAMICSTELASPFAGMPLMYGLMSVFHLQPWLTLTGSRSAGRDPVDASKPEPS